MHKNKMKTLKRLRDVVSVIIDDEVPEGAIVHLASDPEGNSCVPWSGDYSHYTPEEALRYWGIETDGDIVVFWS